MQHYHPRHVLYHSQVSILTRPEGRVQRYVAVDLGEDLLVSILTRPEGRVQRGS